jgi:hypothetical protein
VDFDDALHDDDRHALLFIIVAVAVRMPPRSGIWRERRTWRTRVAR